jgi:isopropylmalate/homocitrate/citramalate synthase
MMRRALRVASCARQFSSVGAALEQPAVRKIELYDTTLRDGTQGEGVSLSLNDKLRIAEALDDMGFDYVEGGYPLSNEKDVAFFEQARKLSLRSAQICAFGMTRRRGVAPAADPGMLALLRSEAPVCTIVGKTWDFHVRAVLRVSLEENLDMIHGSVRHIAQEGRRVLYDAEHFFDGWKADVTHARASVRAAAEGGARTIILCDTNGGTTPEEIAVLTRAALDALADFPGVTVGVHCHNDCELAVANSLAAVEAGAAQVQGTINGIGERAGNADLISIAANLGLKRAGRFSVLDGALRAEPLTGLTELSRFVYEKANLQVRREHGQGARLSRAEGEGQSARGCWAQQGRSRASRAAHASPLAFRSLSGSAARPQAPTHPARAFPAPPDAPVCVVLGAADAHGAAVRGQVGLRAQGRHARARDAAGAVVVRAHRPDERRQRAPHPHLGALRPLQHHRAHQGRGQRRVRAERADDQGRARRGRAARGARLPVRGRAGELRPPRRKVRRRVPAALPKDQVGARACAHGCSWSCLREIVCLRLWLWLCARACARAHVRVRVYVSVSACRRQLVRSISS